MFGLLKDVGTADLRGYLDQLTQSGFLMRSGEQYPTLQITHTGAALLRGQTECVLFRQPRAAKGRSRKAGRPRDASWSGVDEPLFERLRTLRLELSRARGVPPYVIFHDATLRELARIKPASLDELLGVSGIGERKAATYGAALLAAVRGDANQ